MAQVSRLRPLILVLLVSGWLATGVTAQDWPQHRGIQRDAIIPDTQLLAWTDVPPREIWRRPLGESFAGIAIAGERIYTLFSADGKEYLGGFHTADGSELWRLEMGKRFDDTWGNGARSTPTVVGDRVVALGSFGRLVCANAEDGSLIWDVVFPTMDNIEPPAFGYSPSPLVEGTLVISEVGGSASGLIAAFELETGRLAWSTESGRAGYSSPIAIGTGPRRQLIFMTRSAVLALDSAGRTLWRRPIVGGSPFDLPIATPIAVSETAVFASHRAEGGSVLIDAERTGDGFVARDRWESRFMQTHMNAGVYFRGTLFGFHNATLKAIAASDASLHWAKRGFGKGSLILIGKTLVVLTDEGGLVLAAAQDSEFTELGRHQVFDSRTWTPPSYAHGVLYLRDANEMVALELPRSSGNARP